jgi:hypothetical protein
MTKGYFSAVARARIDATGVGAASRHQEKWGGGPKAARRRLVRHKFYPRSPPLRELAVGGQRRTSLDDKTAVSPMRKTEMKKPAEAGF